MEYHFFWSEEQQTHTIRPVNKKEDNLNSEILFQRQTFTAK